MARPGGRAGGSRGCGPAGPGEVRAWVAGLGWRRLGMEMQSDQWSGVPVRTTLYDQISDFFFRVSVSSSVQWGPKQTVVPFKWDFSSCTPRLLPGRPSLLFHPC